MIRILHTSDWHIGRTLYTKKRYEEHEEFLSWLLETIRKEEIDVLLVSGDIFDTSTPSNRAQQLYYDFLRRAADTPCRHIVITAGNHDSPTFLDAPKALLKILNVHVAGAAALFPDAADNEVIPLYSRGGELELIVCAVPYLRDRDVRQMTAGESAEDKEEKLIQGIREHYRKAGDHALQLRDEAAEQEAGQAAGRTEPVPIIGMGHLFAAGGRTVDGDGVRELYIGGLAHINTDVFPSCFDYTALGHLHVPQRAGRNERIRYSGSPIPMGFGEARQQKRVLKVTIFGTSESGSQRRPDMQIDALPVPSFRSLERISGSPDEIAESLRKLKKAESRAWVEIEYRGSGPAGNLQQIVQDAAADSDMEIVRIRNSSLAVHMQDADHFSEIEDWDDIGEEEMFQRCLENYEIPEDQRKELIDAYREITASLYEEDILAD